jgi:fimbrial chaperone protein
MKSIRKAVALALAALLALPASAGEFTIMPVRIFMTARDRAIAITVTNEGNEDIVMQADLFSWKQKPDGSDDLALTEDLVLSPPILKLAPKSRQVVRLARLTPPPASGQQTYRLIMREVPEAKPSTELRVQVALAFSLPIFITAPGAKRTLQCAPQRTAPDAVNVVCENSGNAYAQVRALELVSAAGQKLAGRDTGGYILPNIKRAFDVKKADGRIPGGPVKVQVALDDGSLQAFEATLPE